MADEPVVAAEHLCMLPVHITHSSTKCCDVTHSHGGGRKIAGLPVADGWKVTPVAAAQWTHATDSLSVLSVTSLRSLSPAMVRMHQASSNGPSARTVNGNLRPSRPQAPPQPTSQQMTFQPPPYRSPPHPALMRQQQIKNHHTQGAYSKLNISEPNIAPNFVGSPAAYRHTMNVENSQTVQMGLRNLLQENKHQTLDSAGQSAALQHLRGASGRLPMPGDTYVSPDNLRDAANRMFTRNHHDRSSLGGVGPGTAHPPPTHNPAFQNGSLDRSAAPPQHHHQHQQQKVATQPLYSNQVLVKQQRTMREFVATFGTINANKQPNDEAKRHSFTASNHFGKPGGPLQGNPDPVKTPPQVPPKPTSRSTSKERLKESLEEVDQIDQELKHILVASKAASNGRPGGGPGGTPPLPALSPDPSPNSSPNQRVRSKVRLDESKTTSVRKNQQLKAGLKKYQEELTSQVTQSTMGALTADLESVLGLQTDLTSDESTSMDINDAAAIRRQLDGLENMYAEVLKLLGLRKFGRTPQHQSGLDGKRKKMYGSMSSLPSVSSIGSRHLYGKGGNSHREGKKRPGSASGSGGRDRNINRRFQRLESHVVTLARSVAHLSSELRNQQLLMQEVEALRHEMQQLRTNRGYVEPENFLASAAAAAGQSNLANVGGNNVVSGFNTVINRVQANRVRKLTKFFGDEPPLLRLFLKNLGYEKYASVFEEAKIGLLELPYLSDERLDKLGIPVGPRMRILQEAKITIANEPNYNVYIL